MRPLSRALLGFCRSFSRGSAGVRPFRACPLALASLAALLAGGGAMAGSGPLPLSGVRGDPGPSSPSSLVPVAVFGTDDRVPLAADRAALSRSVGLLFDGRSQSVCSAFCVGDDIAATAGHCLFRTAGQRPPPLKGFQFRLSPQGERSSSTRLAGAEHNAQSQHVATGSMSLKVNPPIDAAHDWALLRLATPLCKGRALPLSRQPGRDLVKLSAAQRVYQVSYHRDFGTWDLAYAAPCAIRRSFGGADWPVISRDFVDAEHVILHTCDTGGASSGSPLLIDGPGGPEVVGINVGTYLQSRVLTRQGEVLHRYKSETVANTAVGVAAFRPAFDAFSRAEVIARRSDLRELQRLLAEEGHYRGGRDGLYGPQLHAAIRAFERAQGRTETGLATAALLKRLASLDAERRGRAPPAPRPPTIETGRVGSHDVTGGRARLGDDVP